MRCPYCFGEDDRHQPGCTTLDMTASEVAARSLQKDTTPRSKANILDEADKIIYGDREKTYGDPAKNLTMIGDLWEMYICHKFNVDVMLSPLDVANLMILLKVARLANTPEHRDSLVDVAGYAALQERVLNANLKKAQGDHTPAA